MRKNDARLRSRGAQRKKKMRMTQGRRKKICAVLFLMFARREAGGETQETSADETCPAIICCLQRYCHVADVATTPPFISMIHAWSTQHYAARLS